MTADDVTKLPLREKLQIMEVIWADLREHAEASEIPQKDRSILDYRRKSAADGTSILHDWDNVKHTV